MSAQPVDRPPVIITTEDLEFPSARPSGSGDPPSPPTIRATLYLPEVPAAQSGHGSLLPALVVGHGAGSNRRRHDSFCRSACSAGFAVLIIDFRGHGESEGWMDGPLEGDILAAVSYLRSRPEVDAGLICYRGSSMGGYYGVRAAPEAGFKAMALLCPANERILLPALDRAPEWADSPEQGLRSRLDKPSCRSYMERHDAFTDAALIDCPVLLVHARGDQLVPIENSTELALRLAGAVEMILLPDGDHSSAQSSPYMHRKVADWLKARAAE